MTLCAGSGPVLVAATVCDPEDVRQDAEHELVPLLFGGEEKLP
jgi:hypothetical protein